MKAIIFFLTVACMAFIMGCHDSTTVQPEETILIITENPSEAGPSMAMDAAPSVISLRYWKTANPGIRWTETFDTMGRDMSKYRLAYNDNGNLLTGNELVAKMHEPIWEGHTFDWWVPVKVSSPQYISRYDTLVVLPNAPDSTGMYWVIGWHTYPNPDYNPNWYAEYLYKKEVFESKLREWFVIQERMWFPIIPGTIDYKWQYVYNYNQPGTYYVDTTPVPGKWNGQKWMITDEDHYNRFAYWAAAVVNRPFWLGTAAIYIM